MHNFDFKAVNLFVGVNGAGKSKFLLELADHYLSENKSVVAVDNSGFGKLNNIKNKKYKCCGAYHGVYGIRKTFKSILLGLNGSNKGLFRVWSTLGYVGYDSRVGIRVIDLDVGGIKDEKEYLQDIPGELLSAVRYFNGYLGRPDSVVWLDAAVDGIFNVVNSSIFLLLKYESLLRKKGLISGFEIYLSKNGGGILLSEASSGELSIVATLLFLSVNALSGGIILIDEPENSLHPQWQKDYLRMIYDVLYMLEPIIFVATHSPIVFSGLDDGSIEYSSYLVESGDLKKIKKETDGVEGLLWRYFGVVTPRNHYLSEKILDSIASLERGDVSYDQFLEMVEGFEKVSYSEKQKNFLVATRSLASKVVGRE